jgi:hypothetical protein
VAKRNLLFFMRYRVEQNTKEQGALDNAHPTSDANANREQPSFACNLLALTVEERGEHAQVTEQLMGKILASKELPDGYAFQFAPQTDTLHLLTQFVTLERLCCPFFTFTIRVEPENGPLWLGLTGQVGIQAFIRAELNW